MRISDEAPAVDSLCVFRRKQKCGTVINNCGRHHAALSIRIAGESRFTTEKSVLISRAVSVTYVPANIYCMQNVVADSEIIGVHFFGNDSLSDKLHCVSVENASDAVMLSGCFERMLECYNNGGHADTMRMYSCFYELLASLSRLDEKEKQLDALPKATEELLKQNLSNADLSISDVAEALGVSEVYLRNSFHAKYGISPRKRLVRIRLKRACEMLASGLYSVYEVSHACGFSSISYFSRVFKSELGIAPSEFVLSPILYHEIGENQQQ